MGGGGGLIKRRLSRKQKDMMPTTIKQFGVITLNDNTYKQFANSLLSLIPDFPMNANEIEMLVKNQGLDSFISIADEYDMGISELVDLLICPGKGGAQHESG